MKSLLLLPFLFILSNTSQAQLAFSHVSNLVPINTSTPSNDLELDELQEQFYINNSGLTILVPFLPILFERCGVTVNNAFIDERSKSKAVRLLTYAATGQTETSESLLVFNKLLSGMEVYDDLDGTVDITLDDKKIIDEMLNAVIQKWEKLGTTTIEGIRGTFLIRDGLLTDEEENYQLKVESKSYDMLMDFLPWTITTSKLPWMKKALVVNWR